MAAKPPSEERTIILARDARRKYGVSVSFVVQHLGHVGGDAHATFDLPSGAIATFAPEQKLSWEAGARLRLGIEGFASAQKAEDAGLRAAQALLFTAISCNFGLRLVYHTHKPGLVYDRLISKGDSVFAEAVGKWSKDVLAAELGDSLSRQPVDPRLLLSMELFTSAQLEPNDRARFVMLVSALEPLAEQIPLGDAVNAYVDAALASLSASVGIEERTRQSLVGRVRQLKQESVRQALFRLYDRWFPGEKDVHKTLDRAYALRSELLHEGAPQDLDIQFNSEGRKVAAYLRQIYSSAYGRALRLPAAA